MLRAEFDHTLREAQVGDDAAFVRLWREANPMLTRYLRVAGVGDPRESARHAWVVVIRDLSAFSGDEIAWRAWLLSLARDRVHEDAALRGRGARTSRPGRVGGRRSIDGRFANLQVEPAELRGINDTIAAIRDLPLGQGEILMLRLMGELPVARVADLVGTDVIAVRRSEDRAVERLGAERELLAWSLGAPALPEELADQRVALRAFRERNASPSTPPARVPAVPPAPRTSHGMASRPPTVVRSRLAILCIAAVSASAMSAGALSAAAYEGVLPPVLQQVMHKAIGAPAATVPAQPDPTASAPSHAGVSAPPSDPTAGTVPGLSQLPPRGHGAGTAGPRDGRTHQTPTAKTSMAKAPSGKNPAVKTSSTKPTPTHPPTPGPRSTGSLSRTAPSAKPTAGTTPPAKGQSSGAHPAKPAVPQGVSAATPHAGGHASMPGATSSPRP